MEEHEIADDFMMDVDDESLFKFEYDPNAEYDYGPLSMKMVHDEFGDYFFSARESQRMKAVDIINVATQKSNIEQEIRHIFRSFQLRTLALNEIEAFAKIVDFETLWQTISNAVGIHASDKFIFQNEDFDINGLKEIIDKLLALIFKDHSMVRIIETMKNDVIAPQQSNIDGPKWYDMAEIELPLIYEIVADLLLWSRSELAAINIYENYIINTYDFNHVYMIQSREYLNIFKYVIVCLLNNKEIVCRDYLKYYTGSYLGEVMFSFKIVDGSINDYYASDRELRKKYLHSKYLVIKQIWQQCENYLLKDLLESLIYKWFPEFFRSDVSLHKLI